METTPLNNELRLRQRDIVLAEQKLLRMRWRHGNSRRTVEKTSWKTKKVQRGIQMLITLEEHGNSFSVQKHNLETDILYRVDGLSFEEAMKEMRE